MQIQVSFTIELKASARINEMEEQLQEAGQQAMRQAMKQAIGQWENAQPICPHCADPSRRLEGTSRRVIATRFGRVEVPRRRFRCLACGRRCCPANRWFARRKGATITPAQQEAATLAGCSWSSRVAARLLTNLSGARISAQEIRLVTNRQGKERAKQQQGEAEQRCAAPPADVLCASPGKQPMLVGLDGGWACSREQRAGMEGNVAVVCSEMVDLPMPVFDTTFSWSKRGGPRKPPRQRHRLSKRLYVATFGPSREIGQQARASAPDLDANPSRPVVVIADGAQWITKEQGRHFPQATGMWDWAPLWREVSHAVRTAARAKALTDKESEYPLHFHRSCDVPAESLTSIQEALRYRENQRPWIGSSEAWRKQGSPVGSGMIERAVAMVINRRMKKRGMRWCRSNATAVVAFRTDVLNEDWDTPQRLRAFPSSNPGFWLEPLQAVSRVVSREKRSLTARSVTLAGDVVFSLLLWPFNGSSLCLIYHMPDTSVSTRSPALHVPTGCATRGICYRSTIAEPFPTLACFRQGTGRPLSPQNKSIMKEDTQAQLRLSAHASYDRLEMQKITVCCRNVPPHCATRGQSHKARIGPANRGVSLRQRTQSGAESVTAGPEYRHQQRRAWWSTGQDDDPQKASQMPSQPHAYVFPRASPAALLLAQCSGQSLERSRSPEQSCPGI
jgi:hypothetical protein